MHGKRGNVTRLTSRCPHLGTNLFESSSSQPEDTGLTEVLISAEMESVIGTPLLKSPDRDHRIAFCLVMKLMISFETALTDGGLALI